MNRVLILTQPKQIGEAKSEIQSNNRKVKQESLIRKLFERRKKINLGKLVKEFNIDEVIRKAIRKVKK